ncbi:tRNA (guanosine(46)-N7)-methyltransferase TrmB [Leptolyngbya sp. FACHB-261]|uniref:tRNA (guanosine(46)-N7)-methyltransferase TrmB n=1 Tax=Leptolyngbya sp. FACHB-261 TaxID=2692806 RepID=UPI001682DC55|nr:tRNA (guanosine(46)-N7)-methyltransferase TrmB [Leptolyngbya sp. FACHB-261]MBD2102351.1 tRNA (guanosine(46)-N7)-methyltransferase TrmB [Leptolyngbya sp. FACHB-261]
MSPVRVREHVNPLSRKYRTAVEPPNWEAIYANPAQPLHLDIGCGKGRFLLALAQQQPDWNLLGLEIREPLVEQANRWGREQGLTNLHYLFCNVNLSLRSLFQPGDLSAVTIQFPDPWFKQRHQKRRVVQPELVTELALLLVPGGRVFVQSDIEAVALQMRERFEADPAFVNLAGTGNWIADNPLGVATERECSTLERGQPVYRAWFERS